MEKPTWSLIHLLSIIFILSAGHSGMAAADSDRSADQPVGLMLTWQQDPTRTMTIDWHTEGLTEQPVLTFRQKGEEEWQTAPGNTHPFPFSDRMIHRVELTGLRPATTYEFHFGDESAAYHFRTMPRDASQPVRFAAGGDVRHQKEWMEQTNLQVLPYDPDFVMFGGDLAYADGREDRFYRWYDWFEALMTTLVTEDRRVIPVIASQGNHEVRGGYYWRDDHENREGLSPYEQNDASRAQTAPYFFELFAMPGQPGYNVLDFGDYMSVILLDSDHTNPVEGAQTEWLESVLAERQSVPHVFPIYHVPAYPSVRSFDGDVMTRVRENWVPLFEQYGVRVAFENHDHVYKRTYPLRNGEIAHDGIVYIGDGAWGVSTREIGRDNDGVPEWYLDRAESVRHFILGTIHGPHQHYLMVDEDGNIFDEYPETPGRVLHRYDAETAVEVGTQ